MAMEIFKLVGSIFVDSDEAEKSISKTDEKAQKTGKTFAEGIKTAGKWAAGIAAGATAAAAGIVAFANKTAATSDEIDKMSQKIGISRESYQELDFILSQNGMDVNILQGGMKTLTNQIYAAGEGTKSSVGYFEELGVSVTDASGKLRSSEEVMYDSIAALQSMDDETERNALANKLFGKSATEMAPLLNSGAGSMEELRQKAHDLGLVLDDEVIDSGVSLTDTMDQLKRSFSGIITRLGGTVMPVVEKFANKIVEYMPQIEAMITRLEPVINVFFDEVVPPLMSLAEEIFPILMDIITEAAPILAEIAAEVLPIISEILRKILPFIAELVQKVLPVLLHIIQAVLPIIEELLPLLEPILELIMALLEPLLELLDYILPPLLKVIQAGVAFIVSVLRPIIEELKNFIGNVLNKTVEGFKNTINSIPATFQKAWAGIKNAWSAVTSWFKTLGEGIKTIFTNLGTAIGNAFKKPLNWIISGINTFIRGLNKIKIPDWVPAVGGKGFHINEIATLATGGVLEKGQTGFLEGNGAEAVVPLENNKKWISAVAADMNSALGGGKTEGLLEDILEALDRLLGMGIYLDKNTLVGELADAMDRKLGRFQAQKARG